jgi:hypothetical protein
MRAFECIRGLEPTREIDVWAPGGKHALRETMESLDLGKNYVFDGSDWLAKKLFGSATG